MLPADIVGTLIYDPREGGFFTKRGPVFANLVLADEINRAPAKVQSALLEAMQERQVTLGDQTHPLPEPFLVMATQNPIEQEGTYPLPEAQIDRFMLKLVVGYPNRAEERAILDAMATSKPMLTVRPVVELQQIAEARRIVDRIYVDDRVKDYIVDVVAITRDPAARGLPIAPYVQFGASPRATISLTLSAKAWAFLHGRGYVTPLDVQVPRARRAPPSHRADLRGRGRGGDDRSHRRRHPRRPPGALSGKHGHATSSDARDRPEGAADRDPHAPPRRRRGGRSLPLRLPRERDRLRRGARVRARRRRPHDRLERHRSRGPPVREEVPRGARAHHPAAGRRERLARVRLRGQQQARARGRARERAGAVGNAQQRQGWPHPLHGRGGAVRSPEEGTVSRPARRARESWVLSLAAAGRTSNARCASRAT